MKATLHLEFISKSKKHAPNDLFKRILENFLSVGDSFEIRHPRTDIKTIAKALKFGEFSPKDGTDTEVSIKGEIDDLKIKKWLSFKAEPRKEKWFPFLALNLPRASVSRNGTEIFFSDITKEEISFIKAMVQDFGNFLHSESEEELVPIEIKESKEAKALSDADSEFLAKAIKSVLNKSQGDGK